MKNIRDFSLEELENELVNLGEKKFRADRHARYAAGLGELYCLW